MPESIVQMFPDLCQSGTVTIPWGACYCPNTPFGEELSPYIQTKPPPAQLQAIPLGPSHRDRVAENSESFNSISTHGTENSRR